MDMLTNDEIAGAGLADWRKLGQGLHARFAVDGFAAAARLVVAVAEVGDELGHHPTVSLGEGWVDLRAITPDAVYRGGDGDERVLAWVTAQDVELARRVSEVAARQGARPDPASVLTIELALDTARAGELSPFWSALLSSDAGSPGDDVRDPTGRVPILWFQESEPRADAVPQRWHLDVWVPPEQAGSRIAAAVAAGGVVVDATQAPSFTVLADADGNRACVCTALSAAADG
ncbi:VOC family protein [Nocardioides marinquilinus]